MNILSLLAQGFQSIPMSIDANGTSGSGNTVKQVSLRSAQRAQPADQAMRRSRENAKTINPVPEV